MEQKNDAGAPLPDIAPALLAWYDVNKRVLPFRTLSTPYRVWVSEIMLQQTRVSAVLPYFERFMQALPTVESLAACDEATLHKLWEGLGYYSRVRNLQKAARILVAEYGGALPGDFAALQKLPGIGAYTAGAIASISFGLPVTAVDGNVLRVFARLMNHHGNILQPSVKKEITSFVQALQPPERAGDYNQALMELGALICLPNGAPLCGACPLALLCRAAACGVQAALPVKTTPKARKQLAYTVALVMQGAKLLVQKRPDTGLLAGLWQPVLLEGKLAPQAVIAALTQQGVLCTVQRALPAAKHVFTHLEWHMTGVLCAAETCPAPEGCAWATPQEIEEIYTLPNAFKVYKNVYLQECL